MDCEENYGEESMEESNSIRQSDPPDLVTLNFNNEFDSDLHSTFSYYSDEQLKTVHLLPERYHSLFDFPVFNKMQSQVWSSIFDLDNDLVVSAPTGSGKTVLFDLCIIKVLEQNKSSPPPQILYMGPVKGLVRERYEDWLSKYSSLDLSLIEVTGDSMDVDMTQLESCHVILTTPEKWDAVTRGLSRRTHKLNIRLFLIDEVHLLNDGTRGPTLEAVVSRIKTKRDTDKRNTRFVAVSATIPNIEDLAQWLGTTVSPSIYHRFDETYRPVELRKIVKGYYCASNISPFKFDMNLSYKLDAVIRQYSEGKPTLIFCSTRKAVLHTATILLERLSVKLSQQQSSHLNAASLFIQDNKLRELVRWGFAYHHAGLLSSDRLIIGQLFSCGNLPVLIATSTLAMGVNLPAHLVVIKSTEKCVSGAWTEYSEEQILQMMGRAGRPQFGDVTATAVIMTKQQNKEKYEKLVSGQVPVESHLHKNLIEHLNAEISLETVTDISVAISWLKSTYMYVRAIKNPTNYSIPTSSDVNTRLQDMLIVSLNALEKNKLIMKSDFAYKLESTDNGRLMANHCISFNSMKIFMQCRGDESLNETVEIISRCSEFDDVHLRMSERSHLNWLNNVKNAEHIRFTMKGKICHKNMKVNCLIQAVLGSLNINDVSLKQESINVIRTAQRLATGLSLVLWQRDNYTSLLNSLVLAKCLKAKLWENSTMVLRQLPTIGHALVQHLVSANKTTFQHVIDSNPRDLERIVNRHPPFGDQLRECASSIPRYQLDVKLKDSDQLSVKVTLLNCEQVSRGDPYHRFSLLIADDSNKILSKERLSDSILMRQGGTCTRLVEFNNTGRVSEIVASLISESIVGVDKYARLQTGYFNEHAHQTQASQKESSQNIEIKERLSKYKFTSGPSIKKFHFKVKMDHRISDGNGNEPETTRSSDLDIRCPIKPDNRASPGNKFRENGDKEMKTNTCITNSGQDVIGTNIVPLNLETERIHTGDHVLLNNRCGPSNKEEEHYENKLAGDDSDYSSQPTCSTTAFMRSISKQLISDNDSSCKTTVTNSIDDGTPEVRLSTTDVVDRYTETIDNEFLSDSSDCMEIENLNILKPDRVNLKNSENEHRSDTFDETNYDLGSCKTNEINVRNEKRVFSCKDENEFDRYSPGGHEHRHHESTVRQGEFQPRRERRGAYELPEYFMPNSNSFKIQNENDQVAPLCQNPSDKIKSGVRSNEDHARLISMANDRRPRYHSETHGDLYSQAGQRNAESCLQSNKHDAIYDKKNSDVKRTVSLYGSNQLIDSPEIKSFSDNSIDFDERSTDEYRSVLASHYLTTESTNRGTSSTLEVHLDTHSTIDKNFVQKSKTISERQVFSQTFASSVCQRCTSVVSGNRLALTQVTVNNRCLKISPSILSNHLRSDEIQTKVIKNSATLKTVEAQAIDNILHREVTKIEQTLRNDISIGKCQTYFDSTIKMDFTQQNDANQIRTKCGDNNVDSTCRFDLIKNNSEIQQPQLISRNKRAINDRDTDNLKINSALLYVDPCFIPSSCKSMDESFNKTDFKSNLHLPLSSSPHQTLESDEDYDECPTTNKCLSSKQKSPEDNLGFDVDELFAGLEDSPIKKRVMVGSGGASQFQPSSSTSSFSIQKPDCHQKNNLEQHESVRKRPESQAFISNERVVAIQPPNRATLLTSSHIRSSKENASDFLAPQRLGSNVHARRNQGKQYWENSIPSDVVENRSHRSFLAYRSQEKEHKYSVPRESPLGSYERIEPIYKSSWRGENADGAESPRIQIENMKVSELRKVSSDVHRDQSSREHLDLNLDKSFLINPFCSSQMTSSNQNTTDFTCTKNPCPPSIIKPSQLNLINPIMSQQIKKNSNVKNKKLDLLPFQDVLRSREVDSPNQGNDCEDEVLTLRSPSTYTDFFYSNQTRWKSDGSGENLTTCSHDLPSHHLPNTVISPVYKFTNRDASPNKRKLSSMHEEATFAWTNGPEFKKVRLDAPQSSNLSLARDRVETSQTLRSQYGDPFASQYNSKNTGENRFPSDSADRSLVNSDRLNFVKFVRSPSKKSFFDLMTRTSDCKIFHIHDNLNPRALPFTNDTEGSSSNISNQKFRPSWKYPSDTTLRETQKNSDTIRSKGNSFIERNLNREEILGAGGTERLNRSGENRMLIRSKGRLEPVTCSVVPSLVSLSYSSPPFLYRSVTSHRQNSLINSNLNSDLNQHNYLIKEKLNQNDSASNKKRFEQSCAVQYRKPESSDTGSNSCLPCSRPFTPQTQSYPVLDSFLQNHSIQPTLNQNPHARHYLRNPFELTVNPSSNITNEQPTFSKFPHSLNCNRSNDSVLQVKRFSGFRNTQKVRACPTPEIPLQRIKSTTESNHNTALDSVIGSKYSHQSLNSQKADFFHHSQNLFEPEQRDEYYRQGRQRSTESSRQERTHTDQDRSQHEPLRHTYPTGLTEKPYVLQENLDGIFPYRVPD